MAVTIKYKSLFQLDILHHYFLSGGTSNLEFSAMSDSQKAAQLKKYKLSDFLELRPDSNTKKIMRGLKQILVPTNTGIMITGSVNEDDEPNIEIEEGTTWTFALVLKDPNFWNYTALRHKPSFDLDNLSRNNIRRLFYFSNTSDDLTSPSLCQDMEVFSQADRADYLMNDLVTNNARLKVFEATQNAPAGTAPANPNAEWQEVALEAYATRKDEMRWRSNVFNYQYKNPDVWTKFELKDANNNVLLTDYAQGSTEDMFYPINMSSYKPGKYLLDITDSNGGEQQYFYYHPEFQSESLLGIIEMSHRTDIPFPFRLIRNNGKVKGKTFEIQFKNRLTHWRYKSSVDSSEIGTVAGTDDALPLTANGFVDTVLLNSNKLPNPNSRMIQMETDANYSDVYINPDHYTP